MVRQVPKILPALIFLLLLSRCAQVVPLSGGAKDVTPPKLIEASPQNNTVNFHATQILFQFDEYVQLRDLPNQLLITPKLKTQPEITASGKKIIIGIDHKELAPNTTYRFAFGKAVADMNESNAIENFQYVFSTGPVIDTLELSGSLKDAFTNNAPGDVLVGLYLPNLRNDSVPYIYTPDYVTRSGDNGQFLFKNLPARDYEVYAINDKNKNNLYDGEAEKIGFLGSTLSLRSDSSVSFTMFSEPPSKTFVRKTLSPSYGQSQVILNKRSIVAIEPLKAADARNIIEAEQGLEKDTVRLFYKSITDTLGLVLKYQANKKADTLRILIPKIQQIKKVKPLFTIFTPQHVPGTGDQGKFIFSTWMDTAQVRMSGFHLGSVQDSLAGAQKLKGRFRGINEFVLDLKLKEGATYTLKADSNTFVNVYGNGNDSGKVSFKTKSKVELGKLTLKLKFNKKQSYIIQLMNEQMKVMEEKAISFALSSSNAVSIDFTDIPPGTYQVKIIYDDNNNLKWDSGDLIRRIQPEKVSINSKLLKILADWEIEEEIIEK